jgi:curved DNA-binding protein CbpA
MALIAAILNFLLSLLEVSMPPRVCPGNNHDYTNRTQTPQQQEASLRAALDFFELDSTTLDRESLKKKFRRYSLLHHPDRNGNTEESKQEMQKVNNFYNILNDELDAREGIHHDDYTKNDDDDDDENKEPTKQQETQQKNKQSKQARKRQRRRRRQNETNVETEMRQEQAQVRNQRAQVKREEQKMARQVFETKIRHGLDTKQGRTRAFQEWKQALYNVKQENSKRSDDGTADTAASNTRTAASNMKRKEASSSTLDDIDDDDDDNNDTTTSTETNNSKPSESIPSSTTESSVSVEGDNPVNLVMECCLQEIVIALRMGLTEAVIAMIQSDLEECITSVLSKAFLNGQERVQESNVAGHIATYFSKPLDEDGNTLLHYAVYYENAEIMSVIYHFAGTFAIISQVFLHPNDYGMMAVDYSMCSRDPAIAERMKFYTNAARHDEEDKKLLPLLKKSARRFWNILCNLQLGSLVRPMSFALSYWIGSRLFGCSRTVSLLLALLPPFSMMEPEEKMKRDHKRAYAPTLFAVHWTWSSYRYILCFLPWMTLLMIALMAMFIQMWRKWNVEYTLTVASIPLLLVFAPIFYIFDIVDKSFCLFERNNQLERAASLLLFAACFLGIQHGMSYYYGEDGEAFGDQDIVVEPKPLYTLFRDL